MPKHLSDSSVQSAAELFCLSLVGTELQVRLEPEEIRLEDGTQFRIDGMDQQAKVLCEFFAHVGSMKDGQKKKLAKDMLKLLAIEHALGGAWRKIICVVDEPARSFLCGKSWCSAVVREFHFEVVVVSVTADLLSGVQQAQLLQAEGMRQRPSTKIRARSSNG